MQKKKKINKLEKYELILLIIIFSLALFIRIYRLGDLLGFYYDQGRDAKVIWDLWHSRKFFLLGPVTGLEGIFLGPFYYYLIAPFYLISSGNPVLPAAFVSFLSWAGIVLLYFLAKDMFDKKVAVISIVITSFSYYMLQASRWFSNPTPIFLMSVLLVYSLWKIVDTKNHFWWYVVALTVGASMHFEAASAVFYIPIVLVFSIWQKAKFPKVKTLIISIVLFGLTVLPQMLFNFRHDNILLNNFKRIFIEKESFRFSSTFYVERLKTFWNVFYSKILPERPEMVGIMVAVSLFGYLFYRTKTFSRGAGLLLIFLSVPFIGYILFKGHNGILYDYYLTGYYIPMILLFSVGLSSIWKKTFGKVILLLFFGTFLYQNLGMTKNYLSAGVDGMNHITLGNQLQSVDWIFEDAKSNKFNTDVYVPPVIPHAYDYLFLWRSTELCGEDKCGITSGGEESLLYTLYEVDPPHPERLEAWLERQKGFGEIDYETSFGGITVQRRTRLPEDVY